MRQPRGALGRALDAPAQLRGGESGERWASQAPGEKPSAQPRNGGPGQLPWPFPTWTGRLRGGTAVGSALKLELVLLFGNY